MYILIENLKSFFSLTHVRGIESREDSRMDSYYKFPFFSNLGPNIRAGTNKYPLNAK